MIRIVIADDHPIVREGVRRLLTDTPDLQVVGEARDAQELFTIVAREPCDVVLLDLMLPDMDGLEVLQTLTRRLPQLPVLVFSVQSEAQYAIRAMMAGAAGYLTKSGLPRDLVRAIRQVARRGGRYISAPVAAQLLEQMQRQAHTPPHTHLSNREYAVLCGLAVGKTGKQLAAELSVSPKTIATYRTRIMKKLHLETNADLIRYAIQHQLIG
jgi:DNA-binding NarL/FixJ family response regulator